MSDPFSDGTDILGGLIVDTPPTPDSVPLRILGLKRLPASRAALTEVFRRRVLETHPDRDPFANIADRAVVAKTAEFVEFVWARDTLKLRVMNSPHGDTDTRNGEPVEPVVCKACGDVYLRVLTEIAPGLSMRITEPHPHPDPACKGCSGIRETPRRSDSRSKRGRLTTDRRDNLIDRGWWEGYCRWCAHDLELERRRADRQRRRSGLVCHECGDEYTPKRSDSRYCSSPCRQKSYRERRADE